MQEGTAMCTLERAAAIRDARWMKSTDTWTFAASQVSRYRGSERGRPVQHISGTRSEVVPSREAEDRQRGEGRRGRVQGRGEEQARPGCGDHQSELRGWRQAQVGIATDPSCTATNRRALLPFNCDAARWRFIINSKNVISLKIATRGKKNKDRNKSNAVDTGQ